ncbi:hypothetical protein, partial [Streptomyces albus]|uniref:hypothetical protein n=2 Tax=Actinomycetes TaxID=1760 RepID=UPI000B12E7DE
LIFSNGTDASVIEFPGEPKKFEDVAYYTAQEAQRRLEVGGDGMAWRSGQLVRGYPSLNYRNPWTFVAESPNTNVIVARQSVVVHTALPRANPLDPRLGYSPAVDEADSDQDYRITVLDQRTGRATGSIRVHGVDSVEVVSPGVALVSADDKIALVGRP